MGANSSRKRDKKNTFRMNQQQTHAPFWQDAPEIDVSKNHEGKYPLLPEGYEDYDINHWTTPALSWKYIDLPLREMSNPVNSSDQTSNPHVFSGAPMGDERRDETVVLFSDTNGENILGEGAFGKVFEFKKTNYDNFPPKNNSLPDTIAVKKFAGKVAGSDVFQELFVLSHLRVQQNYTNYVPKFYFMISSAVDVDTTTIGYAMECAELDLFDYARLKPNDLYYIDANKTKIEIVKDLVFALAFLHSTHTVHLDIKPENILLFRDAQKQRLVAKLADFGLSLVLVPVDVRTQAGEEEGQILLETVSPNPYYSTTDYCMGTEQPLEYFLNVPLLMQNYDVLKSADVFCLGKVIQTIIRDSYENYNYVTNFFTFIELQGYAPMIVLRKLLAVVKFNVMKYPRDVTTHERQNLTRHFLYEVRRFINSTTEYLTIGTPADPDYDYEKMALTHTDFDSMLDLDYSKRGLMRDYAANIANYTKINDGKLTPFEYFSGFGKPQTLVALERQQFSDLVGSDDGKVLEKIIKDIEKLAQQLETTLPPTDK
jgi:serine/threonine protein kinase